MEVVPLARERTNEPGIGIESPEEYYILSGREGLAKLMHLYGCCERVPRTGRN
jgi:hypothetical protein